MAESTLPMVPYRSARPLAKALLWLLGAFWLLPFMALAVAATWTASAGGSPTTFGDVMLLSLFVMTPMTFVIVGVFIAWLSRSVMNLPALGLRDPRSLGVSASLALMLVPFINLFASYAVMNGLWLESQPGHDGMAQRRPVPLVVAWWLSFLAFPALVGFGLACPELLMLDLVAVNVLFGVLVWQTQRRQDEQHYDGELRRRAAVEPPADALR